MKTLTDNTNEDRSWSHIRKLHYRGDEETAARITAEVLSITPDEARRMLDIAVFAGWCMGSVYGDWARGKKNPAGLLVDETWEEVMTDASVREHYANQMMRKKMDGLGRVISTHR